MGKSEREGFSISSSVLLEENGNLPVSDFNLLLSAENDRDGSLQEVGAYDEVHSYSIGEDKLDPIEPPCESHR